MTSWKKNCLGEKLAKQKGEEYGGIAEGSCYIRMCEEKNNILPEMSTGKRVCVQNYISVCLASLLSRSKWPGF